MSGVENTHNEHNNTPEENKEKKEITSDEQRILLEEQMKVEKNKQECRGEVLSKSHQECHEIQNEFIIGEIQRLIEDQSISERKKISKITELIFSEPYISIVLEKYSSTRKLRKQIKSIIKDKDISLSEKQQKITAIIIEQEESTQKQEDLNEEPRQDIGNTQIREQDKETISKIEKIIQDDSMNNQEKLVKVTEILVGANYISSPLGEGENGTIDKDPRFRLDAFDCTTFVETAIAIIRSHNVQQIPKILDEIRYSYNNRIDFKNRLHFPGAEWLPDMQKKGFINDITKELEADNFNIQNIEKKISYDIIQKSKAGKDIKNLPSASIPEKTYSIDYINLESFRANYKNLPSNCILNIVKEDRGDKPTLITHQVLFLKDKQRPDGFIRHASSWPNGKVEDISIEDFVAKQKRQKKWKTLGVNVNAIITQ